MNAEQIAKLKELAENASPGPWFTQTHCADNGEHSHIGLESQEGAEIIGEEVMPCDADMRFIAAANPRAVLELIALAERTTYPVSQMTDATIREIFMAHGFTIKEGQTDLKPYVYAAARALLAAAAPAAPVAEPAGPDWRAIAEGHAQQSAYLQSLIDGFLPEHPLRAIREQLGGEPLHAIFVPDYWRKVDDHGNPPDGLYMAIYKGDGKSLPVALVAYGEREFDNDDEEDGEEECGAPEFCWTEYQEDRDGDTFLIVREVIAYLPVNLDMKSLEAVRAVLPAAPVQQEGDHA